MQRFKTISFPDGEARTLTISFSDKEDDLYRSLNQLSSYEFRELMGVASIDNLAKIAASEHRTLSQQAKFMASTVLSKSRFHSAEVTFRAGKHSPFQRWYPYVEGYSPGFVTALIDNYHLEGTLIYEPFAGTGTTIMASDGRGLSSVYSEINPLLRLLIATKIKVQSLSQSERVSLAAEFKSCYYKISSSKYEDDEQLKEAYSKTFGKSVYFDESTFRNILQLSTAIKSLENPLIRDLMYIAVCAVIVPVSFLKKQGDLRFKTKKERLSEIKKIDNLLPSKIDEMAEDILNFDFSLHGNHKCVTPNAKLIGDAECGSIGAIITSPPYLNGTNYIRNTKLELWFIGALENEKDLRRLRDEILTSGINDVKAAYKHSFSICEKSALLADVVTRLKEKAYDKRIPLMAVSYFNEMVEVFSGIAGKLKRGAVILIDLGDSIFSDVHIPTDKILIELFALLGYSFTGRHVLRTRRSRNGKLLSQVLISFVYGKND